MSQEINDLHSYPILTEEIDSSGGLSNRSGGAGGGSSLDSVVERSLRGILGWRPRKSDPKGFITALKQSFSIKVIEGREEWNWNPHSYELKADLGAVTGAQASLLKRANSAKQEALPLLEGLTSLRSDSDDEDVEASRAIIESNWCELVNEIGFTGGPRVQRVDTLFDSLLGAGFAGSDPEAVGGQLGSLRERLGLDRSKVNTIDEEQNLTNFLILADYTISLYHSWQGQARFLSRSGTNEVYLGTQITLLNRALAALGESVQQAYDVLDSLFIGAAERETIPLPLGLGTPYLTIAELLHWAEYVAQEEAPRMIREGGKEGVLAITPTLQKLADLLDSAWAISRQPSANPVHGFHTARSQNTFQELAIHSRGALIRAQELANQEVRFNLSVLTEGQGEARALETGPYIANTLVRVEAEAEIGWRFVEWKGDVVGKSLPSASVQMDKHKTVTARFAPQGYTLDFAPVSGGTLTAHPDKQEYQYGERVTVVATPDAGWEFDEWIGPVENEMLAQTTVTIIDDTDLSAIFQPLGYTLKVSFDPSEGMVSVNPVRNSYTFDEPVLIAATAKTNWLFIGWSGPQDAVEDPSDPTTVVRVRQNTTVTAHFVPSVPPQMFPLAISVEGDGRVTSADGVINCGLKCTAQYADGKMVTLEAIPDVDSQLAYWEVVGTMTKKPRHITNPKPQLKLTIDQGYSVTAHFEPINVRKEAHTLSIEVDGDGFVTSEEPKVHCKGQCDIAVDDGEFVTLEAVADAGFHFVGWTVDGNSVFDASLDLNVTDDISVVAHFEADIEFEAIRFEASEFERGEFDPGEIEVGEVEVGEVEPGEAEEVTIEAVTIETIVETTRVETTRVEASRFEASLDEVSQDEVSQDEVSQDESVQEVLDESVPWALLLQINYVGEATGKMLWVHNIRSIHDVAMLSDDDIAAFDLSNTQRANLRKAVIHARSLDEDSAHA